MIVEGLLARMAALESEIVTVRDRLAALENPNRPIVPQPAKTEVAPATTTATKSATPATPATGKTAAK